MEREQALRIVQNALLLDRIFAYNSARVKIKQDLCSQEDNAVSSVFISDKQERFAFLYQDLALSSAKDRLQLHLFAKPKEKMHLFAKTAERLALCSNQELLILMTTLGAAIYSPFISSVVLKSDKCVLFTQISRKSYEFVMEYARYSLEASGCCRKFTGELKDFKASCLDYGSALLYKVTEAFADSELGRNFKTRVLHTLNANPEDDAAVLDKINSLVDAFALTSGKIASLCFAVLINEDRIWTKYLS